MVVSINLFFLPILGVTTNSSSELKVPPSCDETSSTLTQNRRMNKCYFGISTKTNLINVESIDDSTLILFERRSKRPLLLCLKVPSSSPAPVSSLLNYLEPETTFYKR